MDEVEERVRARFRNRLGDNPGEVVDRVYGFTYEVDGRPQMPVSVREAFEKSRERSAFKLAFEIVDYQRENGELDAEELEKLRMEDELYPGPSAEYLASKNLEPGKISDEEVMRFFVKSKGQEDAREEVMEFMDSFLMYGSDHEMEVYSENLIGEDTVYDMDEVAHALFAIYPFEEEKLPEV